MNKQNKKLTEADVLKAAAALYSENLMDKAEIFEWRKKIHFSLVSDLANSINPNDSFYKKEIKPFLTETLKPFYNKGHEIRDVLLIKGYTLEFISVNIATLERITSPIEEYKGIPRVELWYLADSEGSRQSCFYALEQTDDEWQIYRIARDIEDQFKNIPIYQPSQFNQPIKK